MRAFPLYAAAALIAGEAAAAPDGYFDLKPDVMLETGDTWIDRGTRYRLYGVQACLRGTQYTDNSGQKRDCGEASLSVLAAYIKDTNPICAPVAKAGEFTYVACYATVGRERLDLASMLITSGFAFAALDANGLPFHAPYAVTEQTAREKRAGLWQFDDVQHPSILLSRTVNERAREAGQ